MWWMVFKLVIGGLRYSVAYDKCHVCQVVPVGLNTADLLMVFGIKETECATASGSDPQTCAFRPGFFVVRRLMLSGATTKKISIWFIYIWCHVRQNMWRKIVLRGLVCGLISRFWAGHVSTGLTQPSCLHWHQCTRAGFVEILCLLCHDAVGQ